MMTIRDNEWSPTRAQLHASAALIVAAGRLPYFVAEFGKDYTDEDGPGRHIEWDDPNAWSSRSVMNDQTHLPALDIDDVIGNKDDTDGIIRATFNLNPLDGVDPLRWVRSSTEGHWHVYIDTPVGWSAYMRAMTKLVDVGLLEAGFVGAAEQRGATFLRMPGVRKTTTERAKNAQIPEMRPGDSPEPTAQRANSHVSYTCTHCQKVFEVSDAITGGTILPDGAPWCNDCLGPF